MDEGFAAFVTDAIVPLTRLARAFVGPDDAADLTHDCLVKMGVNWRKVRRDGNPLGYARTTLARLAVDSYRRRGKRRQVEATYESLHRGQQPAFPGDSHAGPVDEWLAHAWVTLSPSQRVAVALRYLEDADMATVAATLGCSEQTARSHISRGLARLRDRAPSDVEIGVHDGAF
jgi:RNA polymerase sigma factor (sigma-70 family)